MKNLIFGFVLLLFMIGCKDDDNGVSRSELIGTWTWVNTEISIAFGGVSDKYLDEAKEYSDWKKYYVFKDNGNLEDHDEYIGDNSNVDSDVETGSWELNGDKITFFIGNKSTEYGISIENGNKLILTVSVNTLGIETTDTKIYYKE